MQTEIILVVTVSVTLGAVHPWIWGPRQCLSGHKRSNARLTPGGEAKSPQPGVIRVWEDTVPSARRYSEWQWPPQA